MIREWIEISSDGIQALAVPRQLPFRSPAVFCALF